jgi:glyoxylase-like metal-dependent hydrolase (beta-lactamase superfamily II)
MLLHPPRDRQTGIYLREILCTRAGYTRFFGFHNWPTEIVPYDLGDRVLDVIPIPGHEPSSIAIYRFSRCCHLFVDLPFHPQMEVGPGD